MRTGIGIGIPHEKARRLPPNVVGRFDLGGSIANLVTGYEMGCRLPAANGKYVYRFGKWCGPIGANMPRLNGGGVSLAGKQTNLCECVKFNPQAGDEAALFLNNAPDIDIEDMTESLTGTDFDVFKGNAYHLSTINSGAWGSATFPGDVAIVEESTAVLVVLAPDGATFSMAGTTVAIPASTSWRLVKIEGVTPASIYNKPNVQLTDGGRECWFILPHLLRQKRFESFICGDNSAAPATFASEAGSADNGIYADLDIHTEIAKILGKLVTREVRGAELNPGMEAHTDPAHADVEFIVYSPTHARLIDTDPASAQNSYLRTGRHSLEAGRKYRANVRYKVHAGNSYKIGWGAIDFSDDNNLGNPIEDGEWHSVSYDLVPTKNVDYRLIAVVGYYDACDIEMDVSIREIQTIVETPTGDELIDAVTAWTTTANWSDGGSDAVSANGVAQYSATFKPGILVAGKSYVVTINVSGLGAGDSFHVRSSGSPAVADRMVVDADGPYTGIIVSDGTDFVVDARTAGASATFTNISVKPVEAAGSTTVDLTVGFDKVDVSSKIGILTVRASASSILFFYSDGSIRATDGTNTSTWTGDYSAGDRLKCVVSHGPSGLQLTVNDTPGNLVPFNGAFLDVGSIPATLAWGLPDGTKIEPHSILFTNQEAA